MSNLAGRLRWWILGIPAQEATFARRGFRSSRPEAQHVLERVGRAFVVGYNASIEQGRLEDVVARLDRVELPRRGFAYEGAAMGLALLDGLMSRRARRLERFMHGPADPHIYMAHVGVGWAMARLPRPRRLGVTAPLDPLLRWLAFDGYGFHHAYFDPNHHIVGQRRCTWITGYAKRAFDHGLGRAVWFAGGADVARVAATVGSFPASRRPDLWSGVGLAATYAGGAEGHALELLRDAAGACRPHLAQGAAFAAQARLRAHNMTSGTRAASAILCGVPAETAAAVTETAMRDLPDDGTLPAYEVWRARIQRHFQGQKASRS
jgi:hypothetical protein